MKQLLLQPEVIRYDNSFSLVTDFSLGEGDLLLTEKSLFKPYFGELDIGADIYFTEDYGEGEASDRMAADLHADIRRPYRRVVAIGGGAVLELGKILSLEEAFPLPALFDGATECVRTRQLILVPTTGGTGSEVTDSATIVMTADRTVRMVRAPALAADCAVLIPQLLEGLPYRAFAAGSVDAFVHALESSVSPRATSYTKLFSHKAIGLILAGYGEIVRNGEMARVPLLGDFLTAANYAGVAYGNTGLGPLHALAYPVAASLGLPHADAVHTLFPAVFARYLSRNPSGPLAELIHVLAEFLGCYASEVHANILRLQDHILPRRRLRDLGIQRDALAALTQSVQRCHPELLAGGAVPLNGDEVLSIYRDAF